MFAYVQTKQVRTFVLFLFGVGNVAVDRGSLAGEREAARGNRETVSGTSEES